MIAITDTLTGIVAAVVFTATPEPDGVKRGVLTEPTADVRSTVSEARAEAVTVEWTVRDSEVPKAVTGEAAPATRTCTAAPTTNAVSRTA